MAKQQTVTPSVADAQAKADAIVALAATEEARKAAQAVAIATFEQYGLADAVAKGRTTEMAFEFHALVAAGTFTHGEAELLYKPYAEAFDKAARSDEDKFTGSESYASALSTFASFGLPYAVEACRVFGDLYADVKAARDRLPKKTDAVGSNYQCYVSFNRKANDMAKAEGVKALFDILGDADKRAAWMDDVVAKGGSGSKDTWARLARVIADLEAIAKREAKLGGPIAGEIAAMKAEVEKARDAAKAKVERIERENTAQLLDGATMSSKGAAPTMQ